MSDNGKVYLVGAGPGDPGLITVKALEVLRRADVVIYDYLANSRLLGEAPIKADKIYVGKRGGLHSMSQEDINALLIDKARGGQSVVRLKGGDPLVFGRGGEEALALREADIDFEIIPGVTSGVAALTYAGIPPTHRGLATAVTFITGHEDPTKSNSQLNWQAIASLHGTLVFYMGMNNLPEIVARLRENGRSPDTPAAVIRYGTMPSQQSVTGTLATIEARVKATGFKPPALIVVGEVVELRDQLNWFENKPLFGKRIVVTRSRAQASDLVASLERLGADVLVFPTIKIIPPVSYAPLDRAIANIDSYQWIVFTSVNGVEAFFNRLFHLGRDVRALAGIKFCAIGPATGRQLRAFGIVADLQPAEFIGESIVESFQRQQVAGQKVLLPRADIARANLRAGLESLGAEVEEVTAYQTIFETDLSVEIYDQVKRGDFDLITFTSSSTVKNFVAQIEQKNLPTALSKARVACIGPITRRTAEQFGLRTDIQPEQYTIPDLVDAIVAHETRKTRQNAFAPISS